MKGRSENSVKQKRGTSTGSKNIMLAVRRSSHSYQESLLEEDMVVDGRRKRELTAAALKEWEDWEWQQILSEPPEKRTRSDDGSHGRGRDSAQEAHG